MCWVRLTTIVKITAVGHLKFKVPVYCVVGNHEDVHVVRKLQTKELVIPNLHILDENSDVVLNGWIRVLGIGGNFIHWNFFEKLNRYFRKKHFPEFSDAFYPSMRFVQWCELYKKHLLPKIKRREEENVEFERKLSLPDVPKSRAARRAYQKQLEDELKAQR